MEFGLGDFEVPRWDLGFEVGAGLVDADKRRAYADFDLLTFGGVVFGVSSVFCIAIHAVAFGGSERLAELDDEVAFEVGKLEGAKVGIHAVRVVAGDLVGCGIDLR